VAAFSYLLSRFIFLSLPFGYEVAILLAAMACVWQGARTFEGRGRNQVVVAAPSPADAGPESQEVGADWRAGCGQSSPRGVMLPVMRIINAVRGINRVVLRHQTSAS
jgi:hypothetical protein